MAKMKLTAVLEYRWNDDYPSDANPRPMVVVAFGTEEIAWLEPVRNNDYYIDPEYRDEVDNNIVSETVAPYLARLFTKVV